MREDVGKLIGMSAWFALEDIEQACTSLRELGFEGVSLVFTQVASRLIPAPVFEGHYGAAGEVVREAGLIVSTLNCIEGAPRFDPFSSDESRRATAEGLADHLRNARAMQAPGVLIWDGEVDSESAADAAPGQLAECIERARRLAGPTTDAISISIELHPFTFALRYNRLAELAQALRGVGAGICVDFCHFGVTRGGDFLDLLTPTVMSAVNEIHYADTDARTSEFHYPAGRGVLDLAALEQHFAGRGLPAGLDLFQWPAPRSGALSSKSRFAAFVASQLAAS